MNLDTFLSTPHVKNTWIHEHSIDVYVRKSVRMFKSTPYKCLDIASVDVLEDHRGRGIFTAFISNFEREASNSGRQVYVESILNKKLIQFLLKRGYVFMPGYAEDSMSPNMIKFTSYET